MRLKIDLLFLLFVSDDGCLWFHESDIVLEVNFFLVYLHRMSMLLGVISGMHIMLPNNLLHINYELLVL
jgi:hypothetical protein